MNDVAQRAAAAGFLHTLETSPSVFDEWIRIPKDDTAAIGSLIMRTLGLAHPPTSDDLHAMALYVNNVLLDRVRAVQASNPSAPNHVGFIVSMHTE